MLAVTDEVYFTYNSSHVAQAAGVVPFVDSGVTPHARVLLVEDDEDVRVTLSAVLSQHGHTVSTAATAGQARSALESGRFDVVIADLRLDDGENGLDVLVQAREQDPDLVTIILTAYVSTQAAVEALRGGVTNFLPKPCSIADLQDAIQRGLEKRDLLQQLREAQRQAEARQGMEVLAAVGRELASSLDLERLLDRLARAVVPLFADWCVLHVVDQSNLGEYVAVAHVDPAKEHLARELRLHYQPISAEQSPLLQLLNDGGQPRYVPQLTNVADDTGRLDDTFGDLIRQLAPRSLISVPLATRDEAMGVVSFLQSDSGRSFAPEDVDLAQEIGHRAAMAIENAKLYRQRAIAEERHRFLANASKVLDSSLDYQATLEALARLAVPILADWCTVDILDEDGLPHSLAIQHVDSQRVRWAKELNERYPPDPQADTGAAKVFRTGSPELYPDIPDELLAAAAVDEEHLRLLRQVGMRSAMVVPLNARDRTLGVISFIVAESGRRFSEDDLAFAEDLASRAALAVDNARLYGHAQQARQQAERLQRLTQQLGGKLVLETVLDEIAGAASDLLRSPVAGVFLLNKPDEGFDLVAGRGIEMTAATVMRLSRQRSIAARAVGSGQSIIVSDVNAEPIANLPALVSGESVGSLVVAPVASGSGPLGVIEVYSTQANAFTKDDAELLRGLAGAASAAVENARLYRERELDLARLRALLENLPVGVVVAEESSGRVILRNQQAERFWGSDVWECIEVGHKDPRRGVWLNGDSLTPGDSSLARALRYGETASGQKMEAIRDDGSRIFLSVNAAPIRDDSGKIVAAVSVYDDVSDEEELRRQKEEFLAAAAHDLKTPLTGIQGLVQLVQRQLRRLNLAEAPRLLDNLGAVESSTRKMTGLVEELLDVSRLEHAGRLQLSRHETDLVAVASRVLRDQQPATIHHELVLETTQPQLIGAWDESRLERALTNLVTNAIKYSPNGGRVIVDIHHEERDGKDWAVMSVTDPGIGIPEAEREAVFIRFHRAHNLPSNIQGSGIGLSYVRQVILEHGGTIGVRSQEGQGSTFTIELPLEES